MLARSIQAKKNFKCCVERDLFTTWGREGGGSGTLSASEREHCQLARENAVS